MQTLTKKPRGALPLRFQKLALLQLDFQPCPRVAVLPRSHQSLSHRPAPTLSGSTLLVESGAASRFKESPMSESRQNQQPPSRPANRVRLHGQESMSPATATTGAPKTRPLASIHFRHRQRDVMPPELIRALSAFSKKAAALGQSRTSASLPPRKKAKLITQSRRFESPSPENSNGHFPS